MRTLTLALALTLTACTPDNAESVDETAADDQTVDDSEHTDDGDDSGADADDDDPSDEDDASDDDLGEPGVCDTLSPYIDCSVTATGNGSNASRMEREYDSDGRLVEESIDYTWGSSTRTWTYTEGLVTESTYAQRSSDSGNTTSTTTTYTYDADGHLTSSSDGWSYSYDADGRLLERTQDMDGDGTPEERCTREWDLAEFTYVERCMYDRVQSVQSELETGLPLFTRYEYRDDYTGEDLTTEIQYAYEDDCQPTEVMSETPSIGYFGYSTYTYDTSRRLTGSEFNGMYGNSTWNYSYDCPGDTSEPGA